MPGSTSAINVERLSSHELRISLFRFVQSKVGDPHLAEDLTQEILLRGFSKLSGLKNQERLESWLFQIARHTIADHFRQAKPTETCSEDLPDRNEVFQFIAREDAELHRILTSFIRGVVESLPDIYRNALCYTDYEGHTQAELAKKEGISLSGAKSRVQRARQEVRGAIKRCCDIEKDEYGRILDVRERKTPQAVSEISRVRRIEARLQQIDLEKGFF
ncbi:MAG: sigma-70 family RNA polymerase sigma factor [Verrucomicrobiales bacterium]|nr:sigma-70 family RNA polymerase sigma factor [Verrucomicrobiales bacterium]